MLCDRWNFFKRNRDRNDSSSKSRRDVDARPAADTSAARRLAVLRGGKIVEVTGAPKRETR